MDEMAYALDLLLDVRKPVLITGAMKVILINTILPIHHLLQPADQIGYDGLSNLRESFKTLEYEADLLSNLGVLVIMNNSIHAARY